MTTAPDTLVEALPPVPQVLSIPDSARVMATDIVAGKGSGKTTLLREIGYQDFRKHFPQVIFDPFGTLTPHLLFRIYRFLFPLHPALRERMWERVRFVDVGSLEYVTPFPIYTRHGWEHSLSEIAERVLKVIRLSHPALEKQAPISLPNLNRVGTYTGMVLASLSYQLTEVQDLLFNTTAWEQQGLFHEALTRCPEVAPAVAYFRDEYLPQSRAQKSQLASAFVNHVFTFALNPMLRLVFGARQQGIAWEKVAQHRQTVILDFSRVTDPDTKRFAMLWIFMTLLDYLRRRGRQQTPFLISIDEFAHLTQQVTADTNPLATLLDTFIQQYMRNHNIWLTIAHQSLFQLDEHLQNTVLGFGNLVVGKTDTMREARMFADVLYQTDPYMVKHWRKVWGSEPLYGSGGYRGSERVVVDVEPEFMPLDQQQELHAKQIYRQVLFEFLLRPAVREGEVGTAVFPISIARAATDKTTGAYQLPQQAIVDRIKARLLARDGIPAATIRAEQEARLPQAATQHQRQTPPATPAKNAKTRQKPPAVHTASRNETAQQQPEPLPSHRTLGRYSTAPPLDEQQKAFLAFLMEHPDMPVSGVYKGVGVSVRKGNDMRDSLKEQGFLVELELRTGTTGAGRPMKCILPSVQAYEVLGITAPRRRGSVIHRQLQQIVATGASAKGYRTQVEKPLANGGIVDVHLEKGQERIAVEIAIASRPELELAHVRNCLAAGYDQVCAIFADEALLARTETLIGEAFTADVAGRIRLLPVSKIAQLSQ